MPSNAVRAIARLGPLVAFSWSQPAIRTGCRHLRAPRSARGSPSLRVNAELEKQRMSPGMLNLDSGSDWRDQDEEALRTGRRPAETFEFENPLAPATADSQPVESESEPDLLMEKIRKSGGLDAIMKLVERHDRIMNHLHLTKTVEQLFDQIVKRDPLKESERRDLLQDPRFSLLCTRLIRSHRYMSPYAALEVLKLMSVMNVPRDSRIVQTYLHLLKESFNDLSLDGLMYAAFLLPNFSENRVAEALLIAIPIAFEIRMHKEMDPADLTQLLRMLSFCTTLQVRKKITDTVVHSIRSCLLRDNITKELMSVSAAAQLFIRMERGNIRDDVIMNYIFDVLERPELKNLRYALARKFIGSIRYMRAKNPADFHPGHRIFAVERKISSLLPPRPDVGLLKSSDSVDFSVGDNDYSPNNKK